MIDHHAALQPGEGAEPEPILTPEECRAFRAVGYLSYFRYLDHHGTLHLATGGMTLGAGLCGFPPEGNVMSDPVGTPYRPGQLNGPYVRICDTCNERAAT